MLRERSAHLSSRTRLRRFAVWSGVLVVVSAGCIGRGAAPADKSALFEEAGAQVGLNFVHDVGGRGDYDFPEITTGGVALIDYDRDGDLDVWLGGSGRLAPPSRAGAHGRLFRNDLKAGEPATLHFTDVTEAAGIAPRHYENGAAVGDFDDDGFEDLYLTGVGRNELWRNRGDGTFEEVAERAGVQAEGWSSSAAFADLDGDGRLDLVVARYVDWRAESNKPCRGSDGLRDYCGPVSYQPTSDVLYLNRGDGTFENATGRLGFLESKSNGLAVAIEDFDGDGLLDIHVASDQLPNLLWSRRGQATGRFHEIALEAGLAVNAAGVAEASMGFGVGDLDGDQDLDVVVTHLTGETTTLYEQVGPGMFLDSTAKSGVGQGTRTTTAFGIGVLDVENDGDLDLMIANGAVLRKDGLGRGHGDFPYQQPDVLLLNDGQGRFTPAGVAAGEYFTRSLVGRGLAVGDLDDDGDSDVVIANAGGPAAFLRNTAGSHARWLGLRLEEGGAGRLAERADLLVEFTDGRSLRRLGRRSGSYASSQDPRVLLGVPEGAEIAALTVVWADGSRQPLVPLPELGRWHRVSRLRDHP